MKRPNRWTDGDRGRRASDALLVPGVLIGTAAVLAQNIGSGQATSAAPYNAHSSFRALPGSREVQGQPASRARLNQTGKQWPSPTRPPSPPEPLFKGKLKQARGPHINTCGHEFQGLRKVARAIGPPRQTRTASAGAAGREGVARDHADAGRAHVPDEGGAGPRLRQATRCEAQGSPWKRLSAGSPRPLCRAGSRRG